MSSVQTDSKGQAKKGNLSPALQAAQAARSANRGRSAKLSKEQRFALQLARQASSAAKMIGKGIQNGDIPSGEVLRACSVLSGAMAENLFG